MKKQVNRKKTKRKFEERLLLISPPVYDYRLEWAKWHHPTGLLQLASYLKKQKKDVRLIDCLYFKQGTRLSRQKVGSAEIQGYTFNKWHFGLSFEELEGRIKIYIAEGWIPKTVYVTTLNSIWWESAVETIKRVKQLLPKARIVLGGAYPTVHYDHAKEYSGADEIIKGVFAKAAKLSPDLSLYEETPYSTGIYFYNYSPVIYKDAKRKIKPRAVSSIVKEIKQKSKMGVREFLFFDEEIRAEDREHFGELLDKVADAELGAHFVLPGNVSPKFITQDLAKKIKRAKVKQIYLRCDLNWGLETVKYSTSLADYERCVTALTKYGGFKPRDGNLAAMLVAGFPEEGLDNVTERLMHLAHSVGSVMVVPFQYVPNGYTNSAIKRALSQNGHFSPEGFNSKVFPLARYSGKSLEEYLDLMRLASLLNSKYRSKTFDFLGDSLTAQMFRESISTRGWDPFKEKPLSHTVEAKITTVLDLPVIASAGDR